MMRMVKCAALILCCWLGTAAEVRTNAPAAPIRPSHDPVNEEQRAKLRETNEKFRAEQAVLYEKLRTTRKEMEQAAQADPVDEAAIRGKAAVLGQIEGDLALLRARHYKELRTVLPHDQAARQSGLSQSTNHYAQRVQSAVRPTTNAPVSPTIGGDQK
jgi:Spy/CpxP family protein refolding chaperone